MSESNLLEQAAEETESQAAQALSEVTASNGHGDFDLRVRKAKALTRSTLVPSQYQGPEGVADTLIAMEMAERMNMPALAVMQSLNVIKGKPRFSAEFLIAQFNCTGRFTAITYHFNDDHTECYAKTTERATGEVIIGETISMAMAEKEGWLTKSGSKWKTMPGQMMRYRAATFLIRPLAPELGLGMTVSSEEQDDIQE